MKGKNSIVADRQVTHCNDRSTEHATLTDRRAAGDATKGRYHSVGAYSHVVRDLNLVVELYAVLDDSIFNGTAVDG